MLLHALALPRLPSQCEVCRQWAGRGAAGALCSDCIACFAPHVPRCARCALRLGAPALTCGRCQVEKPPYTHTVCATDYVFPWDTLIGAFKYGDHPEMAAMLAARLVDAVQHATAPLPDSVVPVPLAPRRLAERGYNQAWELARRVAKALGLAAEANLLLRPADSAHQADLNRAERQRNLRSAFMVDPRQRHLLAGHSVALVDDVMTTGATTREAATVLLRAGASSVIVWVLARTAETPPTADRTTLS